MLRTVLPSQETADEIEDQVEHISGSRQPPDIMARTTIAPRMARRTYKSGLCDSITALMMRPPPRSARSWIAARRPRGRVCVQLRPLPGMPSVMRGVLPKVICAPRNPSESEMPDLLMLDAPEAGVDVAAKWEAHW